MKRDLEQLRRTPAYPFGEAAHYLSMPTATLRAWCVGQKQGDKKEFVRLIDLDGSPKEGLSLLNLVEAHVLASIRRVHSVSLLKVREALDYVRVDLKMRVGEVMRRTGPTIAGLSIRRHATTLTTWGLKPLAFIDPAMTSDFG